MNILEVLRTNKLVRVFLVILLLFSFFAAVFHHHEAGEEGHDCPVCRLVQAFLLLFILLAVFCCTGPVVCSDGRPDYVPAVVSSFHGAVLANRAPPIFA